MKKMFAIFLIVLMVCGCAFAYTNNELDFVTEQLNGDNTECKFDANYNVYYINIKQDGFNYENSKQNITPDMIEEMNSLCAQYGDIVRDLLKKTNYDDVACVVSVVTEDHVIVAISINGANSDFIYQ